MPSLRPHTPRTLPRAARVAPGSGTLPAVLSRLSRGAAVVAAALLLAPASALAFKPTAVTAAPADTQAGANSNFSLHFAVEDPSHDLKAFVIHLPPGEVGAVTATPLCTQAQFAAKACPANTQVGTTTTHATAFPTPLTGIAVDVPGKLYNLAPVGPEPARLGIRLTPALGDEILLQSIVTVRPGDGGLDSSTDGLPRDSALGPIDINAVDITLFGKAGDPAKGFVSNPTSCAPATTTVDATAYDGTQGSGSASFTPTGCDKLAFAPTLSATLNPGAKGGRPALTTVVESPPGQANARTVQITLPAGLGAVVTTLNHACPEDVFNQGACAPNATIGSAKAETPALAAPLEGPVILVKPAGSPLPKLVIALHGPIDLTLPVSVGFGAGARLQSTLDGLPDTALSRFTLTLAGGADGLLSNARDLCTTPIAHVDASFAGQNGATSSSSVIPQIAGCQPQVSAKLKGLRSRHPVLALHFTAPMGQRLTSVGVSLPRALRIDRRRARKAITVLASGRRVARPTLHLASSALTVGLPNDGARAVQLRLNRGALRLARRLKAGQTVKLTLATADAAGGRQKLPLSVRAAR
jgi:hypothetical protein